MFSISLSLQILEFLQSPSINSEISISLFVSSGSSVFFSFLSPFLKIHPHNNMCYHG
ncbi:hypothetical protein VP115E341_P0062 [Vibrio phage 115E34-1]|nr:hypothetical protein VP115E341_P0062 [Vibrio phage 115E34-1]